MSTPQDPWQVTVVDADPAVSAVRLATVKRLVPRALARVVPSFPGTPLRAFRVVVHQTVDSLPTGVREHLHPETPGLALLGRDEIHIILDEVETRPPNDLGTVLAHEIVHVLLDQYAGSNAPRVPRWLHEGLAQFLSGDTYLGSREEDLIYPASIGRLIRFSDLAADFPDDASLRRRAYAQSFSFVAFLARAVGVDEVVEAVLQITERDGYDGGFARRTRTSIGVQVDAWREWLLAESGAKWRVLFQNCFSYVMIAGVVLAALAGIRRWNRDLAARTKLEREEQSDESGEQLR